MRLTSNLGALFPHPAAGQRTGRHPERRPGPPKRGPRAGPLHPTRLSDFVLLGYDAFHLTDELMTQPLQAVLTGRIGNTDRALRPVGQTGRPVG